MGRFNLNQILSDTSKAAAGGGSAKPRPSESRYEKLSVFDLVPSEDNFYSMREIGELKAAIEIAGKVLQNLVVVPLGDGKYKVIAGHRRRLASIELVNDGKPEYEFVPCVIEPTEEAADEQEIRDGLDLIVTNSQREKTAWDKIEEVRYLREVLEKAKTKPRFVELLRRIVEKTFEDGELQTDGTRDFIAKVLHTSTTQIGRYDTIIRHLSPEFTEELKADRINVSTAYELSGLSEEEQKAAFAEYQRTGTDRTTAKGTQNAENRILRRAGNGCESPGGRTAGPGPGKRTVGHRAGQDMGKHRGDTARAAGVPGSRRNPRGGR